MVFGTHRSQRDRFVSVDTHPLCITCRKAIIDLDIAAYSPSELLQPLLQGDSTSLRFRIRYVIAKQGRLENYSPSGTTIEERLASIGVTVLQEALTPEWIGLLRLAIAEARRFPDLGSVVIRMTRERGAETMIRLLGEAAESGEVETFPAFGPDRLAMTARYFIDLTLLPQLLRALSGQHLKTLHAEIGPQVSQRVAFFLSACRNGGIK